MKDNKLTVTVFNHEGNIKAVYVCYAVSWVHNKMLITMVHPLMTDEVCFQADYDEYLGDTVEIA